MDLGRTHLWLQQIIDGTVLNVDLPAFQGVFDAANVRRVVEDHGRSDLDPSLGALDLAGAERADFDQRDGGLPALLPPTDLDDAGIVAVAEANDVASVAAFPRAKLGGEV